MKFNEDKCHLLISGHKFEHVWADIFNAWVWESQHQKLLGVTIDKNLKFNNHISDICMKAGRKLTTLGPLSRLLAFNMSRLLHKHLGMILDSKLNFKCHLSEKISKANKGIGIIKRLYNFLPRAALVNIYKAFLSPHLDYWGVIYDNHSNETFCQMIESVQ